MGPYTWEETMEKVGVVWGEDGSTVKYSVKRTYRYDDDDDNNENNRHTNHYKKIIIIINLCCYF